MRCSANNRGYFTAGGNHRKGGTAAFKSAQPDLSIIPYFKPFRSSSLDGRTMLNTQSNSASGPLLIGAVCLLGRVARTTRPWRRIHSWAICIALLASPIASAQNDADGFPSFAYPTLPVSFSNGEVKLSGLIMKPEGKGPFPAVVILHGAEGATHNEPAFRVHANAFVRGGFAVLTFDKRGSGKSSGDLDTSDFENLAGDALAAVAHLRTRDDVNPEAIGFLGRSEGGWISCLAASRDQRIKFAIMSSGAAIRPVEQVRYWMRGLFKRKGASAADIEAAMAAREAQWEYYRRVARDPGWGRSNKGLRERDARDVQLDAFRKIAVEFGKQSVASPAKRTPEFFSAFTRKMDFDPQPALMTMRASLMAVIGADEDVVEPATTIATLEFLKSNGHDVTVKVLPKVGHPLIIMTPVGPRYPEDYPEFTVRWAAETVRKGS